MTKTLFFIFALSVSLAACQSQHEKTVIGAAYNSELTKALQQHQKVFNKKRAVLTFDSGASAQSCDEYIHLMATTALKEDINNQLAKSEYLLCDVLALTGDNKLSEEEHDVSFGQALADRLDLRSFPSSLSQMLDEQKNSLSQLDATALKVDATAVTYETEDWRYRLELVATLDVNNNDTPDWLLWLADEAKTGNYRQYQTLIIYDTSETGPMSATPFTATMNAQRK